jgi:uncharacterized protein with HEPN domain
MSERDPRLYCDDILDSGNAILEFVEGLSFEDFVMTERRIQRLSENSRSSVKR